MEDFWKYAAMSLVTVILAAQLKAKPDIAALLNLAACAMAAMGALGLFAPVVSLLGELETLGDLDRGSLALLLKAAGVGLTAEIAGAVCADAGCGSLAKAVRLLGTAAMLCLSVPSRLSRNPSDPSGSATMLACPAFPGTHAGPA